jgi:hypothetical protein
MDHQELGKQAPYWLVPNSCIHRTRLIQWCVYFLNWQFPVPTIAINCSRSVHYCVWYHGTCNLIFIVLVKLLGLLSYWTGVLFCECWTHSGRKLKKANTFSLSIRSPKITFFMVLYILHCLIFLTFIATVNKFCSWYNTLKCWPSSNYSSGILAPLILLNWYEFLCMFITFLVVLQCLFNEYPHFSRCWSWMHQMTVELVLFVVRY